MSTCAVRLRCFVLAVVVVLAASPTGAAAAASGKDQPPRALWNAFPLRERPTATDVASYGRALEFLARRMTAPEPRGQAPAGPPRVLMLMLATALAMLGLAALPNLALRGPWIGRVVIARRAELVLVGTAILVAAFLVIALR
jgi:hypothetical protein